MTGKTCRRRPFGRPSGPGAASGRPLQSPRCASWQETGGASKLSFGQGTGACSGPCGSGKNFCESTFATVAGSSKSSSVSERMKERSGGRAVLLRRLKVLHKSGMLFEFSSRKDRHDCCFARRMAFCSSSFSWRTSSVRQPGRCPNRLWWASARRRARLRVLCRRSSSGVVSLKVMIGLDALTVPRIKPNTAL